MTLASLLPSNATGWERDFEAVIATMELVPRSVSTLWSADDCPVDFLPFLAMAYSVDVWNTQWPEHIKRGAIKAAMANHRIKGTKQSVIDAVQGFGAEISIVEWFETAPRGIPGTFEVTINYGGTSVTATLQDEIFKAVDLVKRESAHYTVQTGIEGERALNIGGAARATQYIRLEFGEQ